MAAFAIVEVAFLPKLNLHRKGAPAGRQEERRGRVKLCVLSVFAVNLIFKGTHGKLKV